jgi:hypothetical protein
LPAPDGPSIAMMSRFCTLLLSPVDADLTADRPPDAIYAPTVQQEGHKDTKTTKSL